MAVVAIDDESVSVVLKLSWMGLLLLLCCCCCCRMSECEESRGRIGA